MLEHFIEMMAGSLRLKEPWFVESAKFDAENQRVDIYVAVRPDALSLVPWVKPLYGIEYDASLRETFGKGESGDVFAAISNRIAKGEISVLSTMISFPFDRWGSYQAISNSNGLVCNIATNDAVGAATSADDPLGLAAWTVNSNLVEQAAAMTRQLGVEYITTEVGYLDKVMTDHGTNANADCNLGLERLYQAHRLCARHGVKLLFESGQHSGAETLALVNRYTNRYAKASFENAYGLTVNDIGINYDTANHLIYGNDSSTNAFAAMRSRIVQVHVKDSYIALADREAAGGFAVDVKWGTADASRTYDTLAYLKAAGFRGNLLVEHEWGNDRVGDINAALRAILLANNADPGDPWISPDVMTGATDGAKCEAALRAQGFPKAVAERLADKALYGDFRTWADRNELAPDGIVAKPGVILAAAYEASAVPAPEAVTVTVDDLSVGHASDGTMAFTIRAEAEDFAPSVANAALLKASLDIRGTADLATGAFSPETLDVTFGDVSEGKLSVSVTPKDAPAQFYLQTAAH